MCLLGGLFAAPAVAQSSGELASDTELHREPDGAPVAALPAGAPVAPGKAEGAWREVTVEGWISDDAARPTRRDGYDLVVTARKGETLRRSPRGPAVGRVMFGALLDKVEQRRGWTRVRRAGWVPRSAVERQARRQASQRARGGGGSRTTIEKAAAPDPKPTPESKPAQITASATLYVAPDGERYGTLETPAPARVLSRAQGWARVQLEGWVREADVQPASGDAGRGVTAAEIRANPESYVGRQVTWRLQLIGVQTADALRSEMPPGQPYLLTRGPLPEAGFVYVTVPREQAERFRAVPPLEELLLRVTVKAARSKYLETPVVELVEVVEGV